MMYEAVNVMPTIMPVTAGTVPTRLEKIPISRTGKRLDAASPKANATTWLTKPGGKMPMRPATTTASAITVRPTSRRWLSGASGFNTR